jgi:hypothetical protein
MYFVNDLQLAIAAKACFCILVVDFKYICILKLI